MPHARGLALVAGLLVGCADPEPVVPTAESHVVHFGFRQFSQPMVDVLFVVESSPAMAAHHDRLIASYRRFATVFEGLVGGVPDLHFGVTTADLGGAVAVPAMVASFIAAAR